MMFSHSKFEAQLCEKDYIPFNNVYKSKGLCFIVRRPINCMWFEIVQQGVTREIVRMIRGITS